MPTATFSEHAGLIASVLSFLGTIVGAAVGYGGAWAAMKWRLRNLEKADEEFKAEQRDMWCEIGKLRDRMGDPFTETKCKEQQNSCRNVVCDRIKGLEHVVSENHKFMVNLFLRSMDTGHHDDKQKMDYGGGI